MKRSPQPSSSAQASRLFFRAVLPLSRATLGYVAGVIRRYRRQIGSCWRKCSPGRQALLVLAHLRKGETFAELAAGFVVSTATAWRYVSETVALLAARAPKLRGARGPRESTPLWCWTGLSFRWTGLPRTGRSTPASTAATA